MPRLFSNRIRRLKEDTGRQPIRFAKDPEPRFTGDRADSLQRRERKAFLSSQSAYDCPFWQQQVNRYALTCDATPIYTTMSAVSSENQLKSNGMLTAYAASFSFAAHLCSRLFSAA